ncbi:MAG: response regulator [Anaerolineae bacterium]|nr:response regulator [Anaerolineae bacterium]MBT3714511.1 response regulator [Anaerolineae bacterium]MBT4458972.1 response regulator [Anaerolineae bacterium]MBT6059889.1 response regulator [Anaerolineae bacterium]MBT6321062.1 response regulator [Anaerolineae bacterium]
MIKAQHQVLLQYEARFRGIFNGVNDAIFVETISGKVLDVNKRACEMFGWTHAEFITKTVLDMVPPENQALIPDEQSEENISNEAFETVNIRANGERFPVAITGRIQKIGKEKRLLVVVRDITEQKKAEEKLHKLSLATSQSPAAIVITDLNGAIEYSNPAFSKITGYTSEEATGNNPRILQSGEHGVEFYKNLWETLAKGETWRGEFHNKNKAGGYFWESASISPIINPDGKTTHYIAVKEDISDRIETMLALEEAKNAAEAATQAKADFLANMSHEIRTPLNAIYGMTGLLLDTPLNSEQQDFVETARGGSETLLAVINNILDFSKLEAGKVKLEKQPFYIRECVETALDLLAEKAAGKMLDLAYLIETDTPPVILGDVTYVRQILVNLLGNAIKFTESGEVVVHVRTKLIKNDLHELEFSVRDTGIGIPADRLDRLFKSFSQIDTSTTRKYGGTGLGLAISSKLAKNMGGTMWVESEAGKGSTFYFTIQADIKSDAKPLITLGVQPQLEGKRVLIVDDNATNRLILIKQTESWGMKPQAVSSGQEALKLIKENQIFDIAILDMQMPKMDGFMLVKEIESIWQEKTFPVIILSSMGRTKPRAADKTITAFLNKPIKTSNLFNVLLGAIELSPIKIEEPKKVVALDRSLGERHPLRILLAEDNPINQKVAIHILKRLGYQTDLAGNGVEVLQALERQSYDVVLMDVQMPEMDGDEATRKIRAELPKSQQPYIVAMTAHALEGDREKYLSLGMDNYVSKPIKVEELVKALETAKPLE